MTRSAATNDSPLFRRHRFAAALGLGLSLCLMAALMIFAVGLAPSPASLHRVAPNLGFVTPSVSAAPLLTLGISAVPSEICAYGGTSCPAGVGASRVTLSANAASNGVLSWPDVQVAFVVETTLYDGVYDPSVMDWGQYGPIPHPEACAETGGVACEESNGVPFFVAHGQDIADSIAAANPHSQVSFALVDYFSTQGNIDDGDGAEYHVDIGSFVPASYFGAAIKETFQATVLQGGYVYQDSDFYDNFLHSSSITALYGAIVGSGLDWSANTHHVVVWIGSSAPRDPGYPENYCPTSSDFATCPGPYGETCEPSYNFGAMSSPNCEGWITSHDGNASDSIAALARTARQCTDSIGHVCTIDAIDLFDTPTDYTSKGWTTSKAADLGYDGLQIAQVDSQNIIRAGCDISRATGGTWDGPVFSVCPNGQAGNLQYIQHGPATNPNTNNPTLLAALRGIGFGPVLQTLIANGTSQPMFEFVPIGSIVVDPNTTWVVQCITPTGETAHCQQTPKIFHLGGVNVYAWNWSTVAAQNQLLIGDVWLASFYVMATGPPFATVPVDACTTPSCTPAGSHALNGQFTRATFSLPTSNSTIVRESFPLAQVTVQFTGGPAPPPPPVPPPVPPPGILVPILPAQPILQPVGIGSQVGVANVSLNATAAGLLAAGFMRVGIKNRPIGLKMTAMAGPNIRSKFEQESAARRNSEAIGRFE